MFFIKNCFIKIFIFLAWLFFYYGFPAYVAIIVFLVCETIGSFSRVFILSWISDFKVSSFVRSVFLQLMPPFLISILVCIVSYRFLNGIWGMFAVCIINVVSYVLTMLLFGLTKKERDSILGLFMSARKKLSVLLLKS